METDRFPDFEASCNERSAQIVQIDNGKTTAAVAICAAFAALAVGLAAFSIYLAQMSAMEQRISQEKFNQLSPRVTQLEAKVYADPGRDNHH